MVLAPLCRGCLLQVTCQAFAFSTRGSQLPSGGEELGMLGLQLLPVVGGEDVSDALEKICPSLLCE